MLGYIVNDILRDKKRVAMLGIKAPTRANCMFFGVFKFSPITALAIIMAWATCERDGGYLQRFSATKAVMLGTSVVVPNRTFKKLLDIVQNVKQHIVTLTN